MSERIRWSDFCDGEDAIHLAQVKLDSRSRTAKHDHDFHECFFVEKGRGQHWTEGGNRMLVPGDFYLVHPNQKHGIRSQGMEGLLFTNIAFVSDIVEGIIKKQKYLSSRWSETAYPKPIVLKERQRRLFFNLIQDIRDGGRGKFDAGYFVYGLCRILTVTDVNPDLAPLPEWMKEAITKMNTPENLRLGASCLVRLCGRSHEHVGRMFKKHLKLTPTQWITQERIRYACRLLETTQLGVIEIAFDCGFESTSYFHRMFKSYLDITPLQYRYRVASVQRLNQTMKSLQ
ncbi:MAG: AraC family transcriptional regulator [Verrucomicrobiota bacterium]